MNLIFNNASLFDGLSPDLQTHKHVRLAEGVIKEVSDHPLTAGDVRTIDLKGLTLMPGLIDAHYHAYGFDLNPAVLDRTAPALRSLWARKNLEETLQRGFTTVRDAAGGDLALAQATERGLIRGPRFFFSGLAISQTGGHGDIRAPDHEPMCPCSYCGALSVVADGPDEVRKAVREQLRRGATQIKILVSGGALSPSDPLWMNQMTDEEIRIAVYEAETRRTYVMAHAHTAEAAIRCVRNGVRSIEHATITSPESAAEIKKAGAYAVPTLSVLTAAREEGKTLGLSEVMIGKLKELDGHVLRSVDLLSKQEISMGLGSDLLGRLMDRQSGELLLRRQVQSAYEVLRSATITNASLLNMKDKLGVVKTDAYADVLVVRGNPLADIGHLTKAENILMVVKGGKIYRDLLDA